MCLLISIHNTLLREVDYKLAEQEAKEKRADELFKDFKEVSITEFFRKNKAHLGYSGKVRSLTTAIHEMVTNSLDACEEARILPEIRVDIKELGQEHYKILERDNGPGIPAKHISDVFGKMLAGTKFHRNIQLRGQQGIGISGVTLYSQITTGKPMKIKTSTGDGKVHEIRLLVNITKNEAEIVETKVYDDDWKGTEIECELRDVSYNISEHGPYEYLRRTSIANPHAKIIFVDPEGRKHVFDRTTTVIPETPSEMKPHPKGASVDDILNMAKQTSARRVSSFLMDSFTRTSNAKVEEIHESVNFDLKKNPRKLTWQEAEQIAKAFEKIDFMAPSSEGLRPIGEQQIKKAVLKILEPEFEAVLTRDPKVYSGGVPFQVEVAVAYGGKAGRPSADGTVKSEVMRFTNRVPLLFDAGGCTITNAINDVDWKRYDIKDFENSPVTVFVNLVSMYVPYTSAGKLSVAPEKEIEKEVKMALMDVGRRFQKYNSRKRREIEKETRLQALLKYSTELALAVSKLSGKDEKKILSDLKEVIKKRLRYEGSLEELTPKPKAAKG